MKQLEEVCPRLLALLSFVMLMFSFKTDNVLSGALWKPHLLKLAVHRVVVLARGHGAFTPQANCTRVGRHPYRERSEQVVLAVLVHTRVWLTTTKDSKYKLPHFVK